MYNNYTDHNLSLWSTGYSHSSTVCSGGVNVYQGKVPCSGSVNVYQGKVPCSGGVNVYQGKVPCSGV